MAIIFSTDKKINGLLYFWRSYKIDFVKFEVWNNFFSTSADFYYDKKTLGFLESFFFSVTREAKLSFNPPIHPKEFLYSFIEETRDCC